MAHAEAKQNRELRTCVEEAPPFKKPDRWGTVSMSNRQICLIFPYIFMNPISTIIQVIIQIPFLNYGKGHAWSTQLTKIWFPQF